MRTPARSYIHDDELATAGNVCRDDNSHRIR